MPIVSVILPTFDRREYLEQALSSILAQTVTDIEVIVVDDGSTDGTDRYLQLVKDERVVKVHSSRRGPAGARNTGVELAKSSILAFCDSDDTWIPDKLERQLALMEGSDPPVLVYSDARIVMGQAPIDESIFDKQKPFKGRVLRNLLLDNFIPTSSVICTREVLEQTPKFEGAYSPAEDYRLWLRLARLGRFEYVEQPLTTYRRHGDQLGRDLSQMYSACADAITNAMLQDGIHEKDVPGLAKRLWQLHYLSAREWMKLKQPHRARRQYRLAMQYKSVSKARIFNALSYLGL